MGLKWGYGGGQAGPCMALVHGVVHGGGNCMCVLPEFGEVGFGGWDWCLVMVVVLVRRW